MKKINEVNFNLLEKFCVQKINRETDLDWQEIADTLDIDCGVDHLRKVAYGIKLAYDSHMETKQDSDAVAETRKESIYFSELDQKIQELQRERYKIQATKLEMQRSQRHNSRLELFYENIRETIQTLPIPSFESIRYDQDIQTKYVLGIGDFHYGATFKSENNEFSREICKKRLSYLYSVMREKIKQNKISHLEVINVADSIQGILRMKDLQLNDIPVVDSVVEISRLIAIFLNQLSSLCHVTYYHCSSANHSQTRPLGSKAGELATEDMERIIVNYISDLLSENSNVDVISNLDREYITFDIFDFKAIVLHGHQIKTPNNVIKDLSNNHRTLYDYAFLGHRHNPNSVIVAEGKYHNIEVLTCPSFVGSDPFSDKLMVGTKAMARLYEFHEINGHIATHNIILN